MTLRLVSPANGSAPERPFDAPAFSLLAQPQRPGELCESLSIELPPEGFSHAAHHARAARLPLALWLVITIEAERALVAAARAAGIEPEDLALAADAAAQAVRRYDVGPAETRRLASYATALRTGASDGKASAAKTTVACRLSHLSLARWALTAAEANVSLGAWVTELPLVPGRERWEAAAAEAAQPLGEWLLTQAARLARSMSAAPQPAA
jgi:hypothetical protein